jgi:hypothetical protein
VANGRDDTNSGGEPLPTSAGEEAIIDAAPVDPAALVSLGPDPIPAAHDSLDPETEFVAALADVPNISQASVWRDSAILIAGATAFLYIANHIYGATYLAFFDVSAGFHGFGLSNLAMIPFVVYLGILTFASLTYRTFRAKSKWRLIVGCIVPVLISATRPLTLMAYGAWFGADDLTMIFYTAVGLYVVLHFRSTWTDHLTKVEGSAEKFQALANRVNDHKLDTPAARTILRVERYAAARVWQLKSILFLACAYLIMVAGIPATAWFQAMESAQQDRYEPVAGLPARVPVYWVGDRVVFLTFDGATGCRVNVQITAAVQSVRDCGPSVRAVVNVP